MGSEIPLKGIAFSPARTFVGTRDAIREIVERLAVSFAPAGIVVALEDAMGRCDPDTLIVCDSVKTATFSVAYSPLLLRIDGTPYFIGGKDGVECAARALAATVDSVCMDAA